MENFGNSNAPVLLITYKRAKNTEKIIKILLDNKIKDIFIYNNGPINNLDFVDCNDTKIVVKKYETIHQNIKVLYKKENTGLKYNIPEAINWVFESFNKVIILEDDCIPNDPFFLFCNILLDKYEKNLRIGQISGSNFINNRGYKRKNKDSYFFSNIINCWGWATWKNRWTNVHDLEMKSWPSVKKKKIIESFFNNKKNSNYFNKIFDTNYPNNVIWDRAWFLTNIINNRLTIIPDKNLISNIGFDARASGPNPKKYDSLKHENLIFPLEHPKIIEADKDCDQFLIKEGFSKPLFKYRLINKLKKFFTFEFL
tara:strand:- start:102 stop:1037 length:936 start_codon:yes stop_codon:yes gene_type:complete